MGAPRSAQLVPPGDQLARHFFSASLLLYTAPGEPWPATWEPERYLGECPHVVDEFWSRSHYSLTDNITSPPGEFRCEHCCKFCKTGPGLKRHQKCCKSVPGSRTGQKSVEEIHHRRRKDIWSRLDRVEMANCSLPNTYVFPYLGVRYCGDGNTQHNLDTRKAQAFTRFYQLLDLWKDPDVNVSLKLNLYRSLVISKFIYGHEAWLLDAKTLQFVNGFNSKCLSFISGRSIREEAVNPSFDLCQHLRAARLRLLGHILRMDTDEPVRQVITSRGTNHRTGDLFMDAPIHESIDELTALAFDKHQWRLYVMALAGEGEFGTQPANTPEETKAAIDELPINSILAYTDGGCDGNGAGGK